MKSWSKTGVYSYKLFLGSLIYKHLWPERIWVASSVDLGYTYSSHCNGLNKSKLGRIITALFLVLLQQLFTVWWTLAEQVNLIWGLLAPSSYNNSLNNFLYKHKAFDKDLPYTYTSIYFFSFIYSIPNLAMTDLLLLYNVTEENFLHVDFHHAWNAKGAMYNLIKSSSRKLGIYHFFQNSAHLKSGFFFRRYAPALIGVLSLG